MINRERLVDSFLEYVQIDSTSRDEMNFAEHIRAELESMGMEVTVDSAGDKIGGNTGNMIGKLKGNRSADPILFSCHMDTVVPGIGIKPVVRDNTIYSDGTTVLGSDDKAGIAVVIEALRALGENSIEHGTVEVVFSIAEEVGLMGSKNLDYSSIDSKMAFVLDSGGSPGEIIVSGPAQDKISARVFGKAAHAGLAPENGISAINVAAQAISRMNLLRIDENTTANIGSINGGKATNIVTPEVEIKAEARSLCNDKLQKQSDHMVECFETAAKEHGAQVEVEVIRAYNAFSVDSDENIVKIARKACENIGVDSFLKSSGGGSDTNVFNENGIKAVNLGIGMKKVHTLEEYISIEDLENSARLVLELIKTA
ncbi:peptidase T-like protein [Dethiosulfatibacter aminovorans DSM 17477]|uniref:Peptidase T-like protein n=1 Tax=Dethiosulfatibacter aminovorans DSM 17477 TaxID=1121476 RepID=A0A1M6C898_9FIRM|nr:M20/M25/M40 family metallo-hydrolase [Dethiosulfatibacter aminovorans]SHI57232.1 peptidase T-like protein [Dethiosulfatibacter aminovorans DSM 17477]